jgi:DNA-binding NarL/FixJ family response regulator
VHEPTPRPGSQETQVPTAGLRVVVVDDHTFYREGLVGLLRESGVDVVAEFPRGETALDAVDDLRPDVVIVDVSMPGLGGIETARRLTSGERPTQVLMLSVSQQEEDILEALLAGASGFVLKDGPVQDVVTGIERAAARQPFFSERVAPRLLQHVQRTRDHVSPLNQLTPREADVLTRLAEGQTPAAVAAATGQTEAKVRHCVASIILKLQEESRGEIAVRALRDRIV